MKSRLLTALASLPLLMTFASVSHAAPVFFRDHACVQNEQRTSAYIVIYSEFDRKDARILSENLEDAEGAKTVAIENISFTSRLHRRPEPTAVTSPTFIYDASKVSAKCLEAMKSTVTSVYGVDPQTEAVLQPLPQGRTSSVVQILLPPRQ